MRKVKLGSIFRLGRINNKIVHSIRSEGKLLAVLHSVALGFCLNASILLCRLQLPALWHHVCGGKEGSNTSLTLQRQKF